MFQRTLIILWKQEPKFAKQAALFRQKFCFTLVHVPFFLGLLLNHLSSQALCLPESLLVRQHQFCQPPASLPTCHLPTSFHVSKPTALFLIKLAFSLHAVSFQPNCRPPACTLVNQSLACQPPSCLPDGQLPVCILVSQSLAHQPPACHHVSLPSCWLASILPVPAPKPTSFMSHPDEKTLSNLLSLGLTRQFAPHIQELEPLKGNVDPGDIYLLTCQAPPSL